MRDSCFGGGAGVRGGKGNLHYTVGSGCCGSGLGTGAGLAGAPSADSESPQVRQAVEAGF